MSDNFYFKSCPKDWFAGEVQSLPYEEKGMYSDIMHYYWLKECKVTFDMLKIRFQRDLELLEKTCSKSILLDILEVTKNGEVVIKFLSKQYSELNNLHEIRVKNGRKGGYAKHSSPTTILLEQKPSSTIAPLVAKPSIQELELELDIKKDTKVSKESEVYRKFAHLSITVDDNAKLVTSGYSQEQIDNTYDSIENYKKNKDYKSLYLTAKKWLSKEAKQVTTEEGVSEDFQYILDAVKKDEERYGKGTQWYADNCN